MFRFRPQDFVAIAWRRSVVGRQVASAYRGTLLLATIFASLLGVAAELIGSADYEGSFRFDSNWGARYQFRETFDGLSRRGIYDLLGVPVFDGGQGLGHRLPNFVTTPHSSPLITLSGWIPAHLLSLSLVWLSLVLCWSAFDTVCRSWAKSQRLTDRIWFSSFISSLTFVMLLYNDWSLSLVGMLSSLAFSVSLFDRRLWVSKTDLGTSARIPVSMALASLILMSAAHPTFWFVLPPVVLWVVPALRNVIQVALRSLLIATACIVLVYIVTVFNLEYRHLQLPSSAIRNPLTNSFDFLKSSEGHASVLAQVGDLLVTNTLLPMLLVADRFGWELTSFHTRESFLNFGGLLFVLFTYAITRRGSALSDPQSRVSLRLVGALVTIIFWMAFGSSLQWLPTPLRLLFVADGWFYQFLGAGLVITAAIVITSPEGLLVHPARISSRLLRSTALATGVFGLLVALLFPLALLRTAPTRHWTEPRRDMFSSILDSRTNEALRRVDSNGGRLAEVNPGGERGFCTPGLLWKRSLDVSHPLVVARSGLPTVESSPGYRSSGVAVSNVRDVVHCDSLLESKCNLTMFDFLSIGMVFAPEGHPLCDGFESVRNLAAVIDDSFRATTELPAFEYHSYFVSNNEFARSSGLDCSLSSGCLSGATKSTNVFLSAPWQICNTNCWFTYKVGSSEDQNLDWLLLPVRYDSAISVEIRDKKSSLETAEYRGLLAARTAQSELPYDLIVKIDPDFRMLLLAVMPWATLAALVGLSVATVRASRSRRVECPDD